MTKTKQRKPKDRLARKRANPAWEDIVKENALLVEYYKAQCILPEEEWETFWSYCRKDLPSTFRITKIRGHANDLLHSLRDGYISKISAEDISVSKDASVESSDKNEEESEQDLLLEPIKWYPGDLAWNSNLSRRFIRRSEILQKLHRFLVEDSECGAITRQEAVSMIPPMLLDVKPHHLVLDMCAAPGSKTAQIIEMMHDVEDGELPTGAVIANDADHKRCYLLTHQANRLKTHCVIVTNHDATIFPKLYSRHRDTALASELLEFDRVLCDVPCSGDGTIRKNPLMWTKWTPHLGVSLHRLQMRILIRGLELLKVGGRLVYSTCSFNPIENEAVIAAVLSKSEGSIELVDCSNELQGLERRPGMTTWKVFSKTGKEYESMEAVDCKATYGYKESMFPLPEEEVKALNLQYCMRIFPHLQNTGGFFIAVLHKKEELPWQKAKRGRFSKMMPWEEVNKDKENDKDTIDDDKTVVETESTVTGDDKNLEDIEDSRIADNDNKNVADNESTVTSGNIGGAESSIGKDKANGDQDSNSSPPKKKFRRGMIKEAPYIFLDDADKELAEIRNFYKLSSQELPSHQFLIRGNEGKRRHIYLVSTGIHKIISLNNNLRIINTGLRVVSRSQFSAGANENGLSHRLVQDGVHLMSQYIKDRIVLITHQDLVTLLTCGDTAIEKIDIATREQLAKLTMGCVLWHYSPHTSKGDSVLTADIWLCGHYGHKVVQCMITKEEKKHYLRLLGVPIPTELQAKVKGPSWGDSTEKTEDRIDDVEGEGKVVIEGAFEGAD